jgi:tripartite-type tricarboxylate transporter receptor subunit TctC
MTARAFVGAVLALLAAAASAQPYPAKPLRWVIATVPGSAFDGMTRAVAAALSPQLGQPVYTENIGGASGFLGMSAVARAPADGYNLLTAGSSHLVFNKFFHKSLPYDPENDYVGVSLLGDLAIALWVSSSVGVRNFAELLAYSKAHPGKLNYGSGGVGHILHLGMVMIEERGGVKATHVPYKGLGTALQDFYAGRLDLMLSVAQAPMLAGWKAGKFLPVVAANPRRLSKLPDVPTLAEAGVQALDIPNWVGLVVRRATPRDIVARLNQEVIRALDTPLATKTFDSLAMEKLTSTSEEFERRYRRDIVQWGPLVAQLGVQPE